MIYHLAIDIGASSGRHCLGYLNNGRLELEEIYRFDNGVKKENGNLVWDVFQLFNEVVNGISQCKKIGKLPATIAIDTWGVDYVLLDSFKNEILPAVAYRDGRTADIQDEVSAIIDRESLYDLTGVQHQNFNSIYRLYCDKKEGRLKKSKYMLMMPEYLSYKLTGKMCSEYTNATTTGLINAKKRSWDSDLIDLLGFPRELFNELKAPPCEIGALSPEIADRVGFSSTVLLCPSHDTASAVMASPLDEDDLFISSGTWSLVGVENKHPITSSQAKNANLTNEGGIGGTYRFLKNIMGMWIIQGVRKSIGKKLSYDEMMRLAEKSTYRVTFNPNDESLNAPDDMLAALRRLLADDDLPLGDVLSSIYHSLARSYGETVREIERISSKNIKTVRIIGGGSKDEYLNRLTVQYTGKTVTAGPVEATAIGNLVSQIMFYDRGMTIADCRNLIKKSFNITTY